MNQPIEVTYVTTHEGGQRVLLGGRDITEHIFSLNVEVEQHGVMRVTLDLTNVKFVSQSQPANDPFPLGRTWSKNLAA